MRALQPVAEGSNVDGAHRVSVGWVADNHGYPFRASCSCGWVSRTHCGDARGAVDGRRACERGEMSARVTEVDVDLIDAADRLWLVDWANWRDGAGCAVEKWEAQTDFLTCGCRGRDWSCGHYGWSVEVVRPAS